MIAVLQQTKPTESQPSSTANGPCQECTGSDPSCWVCDGSGFEPVYFVAGTVIGGSCSGTNVNLTTA